MNSLKDDWLAIELGRMKEEFSDWSDELKESFKTLAEPKKPVYPDDQEDRMSNRHRILTL